METTQEKTLTYTFVVPSEEATALGLVPCSVAARNLLSVDDAREFGLPKGVPFVTIEVMPERLVHTWVDDAKKMHPKAWGIELRSMAMPVQAYIALFLGLKEFGVIDSSPFGDEVPPELWHKGVQFFPVTSDSDTFRVRIYSFADMLSYAWQLGRKERKDEEMKEVMGKALQEALRLMGGRVVAAGGLDDILEKVSRMSMDEEIEEDKEENENLH